MRRTRFTRVLGMLALAAMLALLLSGCDADTPQNTFAPKGDVADQQRDIFLIAMWPAIFIMILVEVGLVVILLRFRRTKNDDIPVQTHGNTPLELAWTIAPAILLMIISVPMMIILFDVGREPDDDAFVVNVEGQRFSWVFEYPSIRGADGEPHTTVGEMFIPVDEEIAVNLTAIDVIHSFAVPRIAGTRDAIPSDDTDGDGELDHVETMWIKVDEPSSYFSDAGDYYAGQCRELCGTGHADMKIRLYALDEDDFERWMNEVTQASADADGADDAVAER